ncbi:unnamed protein product [Candida verbasci]|uniref:MHD domain-containing protein n=1 Tax=Candida verbasci TaxID=1227364 RepID=A0A9W4TWR1_9ASCO|nr:unnamed protein product [Candida verbasci]
MITALFIYDTKGDILISKLYKDGIRRNIADVFRIQVINQISSARSNRDQKTPVLTLGSTSFIYIKSGGIWICAVTRSNQDCAIILEFLYKFESLLKIILFQSKKKNINESILIDEVIINNFTLIYELLDEVCDFGYPTNLDLNYLKKYVTGLDNATTTDDKIFKIPPLIRKPSMKPSLSSSSTLQTSNSSITWRSQDIKYRRNEVFLNIYEKINVIMTSQCEILRSYIEGSVQMKTHLSGMPLCRFGFNENTKLLSTVNHNQYEFPQDSVVLLEDSKFHQCVQLAVFENEGIIQFIPPDGEFQLMTYNCNSNINLPYKVFPQIQQIGRNKLSYKIRIKSYYPSKLVGTNVVMKIPTPRAIVDCKISCSNGNKKAKSHAEENMIHWEFNKFYGDEEHILTAQLEIDSNSDVLLYWTKPPITLDFTLDMFSSSGLTVKYLRVQEKSNYKTVKWIKYASQSGSYEIRY